MCNKKLVDCYLPVLYDLKEGEQTIFYNNRWKTCSRENASYYRVINLDSTLNPVGMVKDYYMDGTLQSEGKLTEFNFGNNINKDVADGIWNYYYSNGNLSKISLYENNVLIEHIECRDENGKEIKCN